MKASTHEQPIGAFDSGVGGLTVVQAMRELLPAEDILYLGDTARVPYGNKSPDTIIRYSREIMAYLRGNGVKAVVVACNTASAHALSILQKEADIPVIGVIAPGVEAALAATRNGRIGVIGTQGTIQSEAYQNLLRESRPGVVITAVAAPLLVSLVEEDWLSHPATHLILEEYLAPMKAARVDTVVLACTHYPLLKLLAQRVLGSDVVLVDSAQNAAAALARKLEMAGLSRPARSKAGQTTICSTDVPAQFARLAERFLGKKSRPSNRLPSVSYSPPQAPILSTIGGDRSRRYSSCLRWRTLHGPRGESLGEESPRRPGEASPYIRRW